MFHFSFFLSFEKTIFLTTLFSSFLGNGATRLFLDRLRRNFPAPSPSDQIDRREPVFHREKFEHIFPPRIPSLEIAG